METPSTESVAFKPITLYDAPGLAISQVLGGDASAESFKNLFLSPDRLSPEQRKTLADRLVGGGDGFTKALTEVVTNPWVWLMFVTSPVGMKALQAGKQFSFVGKTYNEWAKKSLGFLAPILSDLDVFPRAQSIFLGVADHVRGVQDDIGRSLSAAEKVILPKLNQVVGGEGKWALDQVDWMNPNHYREGSKEYEALKTFHILSQGKGARLDETVLEGIPYSELKFHMEVGGQRVPIILDPLAQKAGVKRAILKSVRSQFARDEKTAKNFFFNVMGTKEREGWGSFEDFFQSFQGTEGRPTGVFPEEGLFAHVKVSDPKGTTKTLDDLIKEYEAPVGGVEEVGKPPVRYQKQYVQGNIGAAFRQVFGGEGEQYLEMVMKERQKQFVRVLGDEAHHAVTGQWKADKTKLRGAVTSLLRDLRKPETQESLSADAMTVQGKDLLYTLVGEDGIQNMRGVGFDAKEHQLSKVLDELEKTIQMDWDNPYWTPRNTYDLAKVQHEGQMIAPPTDRWTQYERSLVDVAPGSAINSGRMSNRIAPLTSKKVAYAPEDLEWFRNKSDLGLTLTQHGEDHILEVKDEAQRAFSQGGGKGVMTLTLRDGDSSRRKFLNNVTFLGLDTVPVSEETLRAMDEGYLADVPSHRRHEKTVLAGGHEVEVGKEIPQELRGFVTHNDLVDRYHMRLDGELPQKRFRTVAVPNMLGHASSDWLAVQNAHIRNKEMALWFANKGPGKLLEKVGGEWGKDFVGRLREFGHVNNKMPSPNLSSGISNYLYLSHLGLNLGSVVMQLTQPLLLAATAGKLTDVVGAYGDAFQDMGRYASKRVGRGAKFLSALEQEDLFRESFQFSDFEGRDLLRLNKGSRMLDLAGYRPGGVMGKVSDVMLGGFQHAEMFNRNFAAHLMKRMYKAAGREPMGRLFADDVEAFLMRTQFTSDPINTPQVMGPRGPMGNPLVRMFLTFPIKQATGALYSFPRMGGEENYWNGLKNTIFRGMGMSAIVYEVGKGLMGADMSRGLFASATGSLVGGDRLLDKNSQILPVPPVIDIPVGLMRGLANEDMGMLANSVARLVPGGVAINRAVGLLPQMPRSPLAGLPGVLQKQYVDYKNPLPTGEVPVFKGDGTLVAYRKPSEIVAKSLGVDMGKWEQEGGLDNYLAKQREEILSYRQRYLQALAGNDVPKAQGVAADFQKKFKGIPLTVTQTQVKSYLRSRVVGRTERSLDRIPPEVRWQYQKMVEMGGGIPGLTAEGLQQPTATGRNPFRTGISPLQAEALLDAQRQAQSGGTAAPSAQAFQPFGSFQ